MIEKNESKVDKVRSNPKPFLGNKSPNLFEFASELAVDAMVLGAKSIAIDILDDWFIVSSEFDWILCETELDIVQSFNKIQIFHKHRMNSCRANILVNAFTNDLFVMGLEGLTVIKGSKVDIELFASKLRDKYSGKRLVVFKGLNP